jgi:hypothetical protein
MAWSRQKLKARRCIFLEGESPIHSLFLGTLCQNLILSNSTFGWWAAWLNPSKRMVIAPQHWFGSAYAHYDTRDLLPKTWVKM